METTYDRRRSSGGQRNDRKVVVDLFTETDERPASQARDGVIPVGEGHDSGKCGRCRESLVLCKRTELGT